MMYPHKKMISGIALFILLMACSVLVGWYFDITILISLSASMTAMNPLTAITFITLSAWLLSNNYPGNKSIAYFRRSIVPFVFFVGVIKLLEYLGLCHIAIDDIIFKHRLESRLLHNAIAPTTALLFTLSGILLISSQRKTKTNHFINDSILIAAFLTSYIGMIGYIYSLEPFYRIGPFVPMALNTASCFLLFTVAMFFLLKDGYIYKVVMSAYMGGKLARRAVPLLLFIPPAFGYSKLLMHRADIYNVEYSVALDTAILVLIVLLLICFYAGRLNKQDVQRLESERQIKESEEKFRSLVYAMKEGVVYYDRQGNILLYNPSMSEMLGYDDENLTGKNIIELLVTKENYERAKIRLAERLEGKGEDYESQFKRKDGLMIHVSVTSRPILDKDMRATSFISTITDITERKKKEEDIEAFSASAAHDMNAPLAKVAMITDLLLDNSAKHLIEKDIHFLKMIEKINTDMRTTLQDLLHFSRVGHEKIVKERVDINAMVKEIVDSQHYINPVTKINIGVLPSAQGSAAALKHVWMNLISNALKYSTKTDHPEITITGSIEDGKSLYSIKDNGVGFSMLDAEKLFVPFKRLHADFEGNGLGLPIVKRIIEKHGGRIWAESEIGKGAVFYFVV